MTSSANGHCNPAAAARFRLSWIVLRATPRAARSRARSPHRGEAAISTAIVASSVPASPAFPFSSSIIDEQGVPRVLTRGEQTTRTENRLRWPASSRNGGRLQIGTLAGIKSESPAGLHRNSHTRAAGRMAKTVAHRRNSD